MGYLCPVITCSNHRGWSNKEWIDDGRPNTCPNFMCGALIVKDTMVQSSASVVPAKSKNTCGAVSTAALFVGSSTVAEWENEAVYHKQRANVVVSIGQPANLELVYPPIVCQSVDTENAICRSGMIQIAGPTAMCPKGVVQPSATTVAELQVSEAPAWLVPKASRAAAPRKAEIKLPGIFSLRQFGALSASTKLQFLKLHGFDAIVSHLRASECAFKKKRAALAAHTRKLRSRNKKKRVCKLAALITTARKHVAMVQHVAECRALVKELSADRELTPDEASFVKLECEKSASSRERWSDFVRTVKAVHKKRVAERLATRVVEEDIAFSDADWVFVPKHIPRSTTNRMRPLERALETLQTLWWSPHYTVHCKQRLQELWDCYPTMRLSVGRFAGALLQGAKFSDAETLEGNFFLLDDVNEAVLNEISEGIEDEFAHFTPREFAARAGMVQWVKESVSSLGSKIASGVLTATHTIEDFVIAEMHRLFNKIMAPFTAHLETAQATLKSFWEKCAGWVKKIRDKASATLEVLYDHALWALVAMLAGGVVVLAETILKALGVFDRVGNVLGIFLTLFLTSLGFTAVELGAEKMAVLHNTFKIALCKMIQPSNLPSIVPDDVSREFTAGAMPPRAPLSESDDDREFEARSSIGIDAAISAISSVGRSLISFKLGTLVYWGKIGSAFDQLWRGKKAIEELASWLIEVLGSLADTVTGRHLEFFDELSALVGTDVKSWLKRSHDVRLQCQTMDISNRVVLNTIECLLEDGHKLLIGVAGTARRTSTDFAMVIKKEVEELSLLRARCARAGRFEGTRMYPFWVYVFGASQSGKTIFTNNMLAPELLSEMNLSRDSIYTRPKTDQYWSNYARQSCIMIDDFYAVKTVPSIESQMIDVVNSQAFPLNMAYLEDKGMLMDSPLVITTCNDFSPPTDCDVRDLPSFYNRRAVVVEIRRKEDTEYDPQSVDNCSEARLLQPKWPYSATSPALHVPLTDWTSPTDVLAIIKTKLGEHVGKESIRIAEFMRMRGDRHPIFDLAKDFLKDLDLFGHPLEDYVVEGCNLRDAVTGKKPTGFRYLALDNRVFVYNALGRLNEVLFDKFPPGLDDESLNTVYPDIHVRLARGPKNGFVGSFLHEMVNKSHCVLSVDALKTGSSAETKQFFSSLPLTERVFLRLSQLKIEQIGFESSQSPAEFAYAKIIGAMKRTYDVIASRGRSIFLLLAAMICIIVSLYGFFAAFSMFSGGSSVVAATLAIKQMDACAVISSSGGSLDSRKPGRYQPVAHRHVVARAEIADNPTPDWYKLIVEIHTGTSSSFISTCQFKGRSLLMTRHQALNLKDGQEVVIEYEGQYPLHHVWRIRNLIEFDDNELVVYASGDLKELSKANVRKYFFSDIESEMPKLFRAHCAVSKLNSNGATAVNEWAVDAHVVHETATIVRYNENHQQYIRKIPKCIEYGFNAVDFDCGALCMVYCEKQWKVAGLLVGVSDGITCSAILPNYSPFEAKALCYHDEEVLIAPGYSKLGWLYRDQTPHMPSKTQFIEVPKQYQPADVEVKQPAILSKDDERLPQILADIEKKENLPVGSVLYDPLVQGMEKFSHPMCLVDEKLLRHVADEVVSEWFDCLDEPLRDVSLDVAINGSSDEATSFLDPLVMSTSEGYPFVLSRVAGETGKSRFFSGEPGERILREGTDVYNAYVELVENDDVPELICVECPKDECLPERKILKPKTRLFSILPLHFNLRLREKFLSFASFVMSQRSRLPCQVGINVYSREWMNLYTRMARISDSACNCDYQSFDGLMTYQFLDVIGDMINSGYRDDTPRSLLQRKNLLLAIYRRKSLAGNQVLELRAGIPSGCALTVLLNSIFNELLVRLAYHSLVPPIYRDRFSKTVCLLVYGDDNLIATSQSVIKFFNGNTLKQWLAQYDVVITDGKDKMAPTIEERPLQQLDFLKRGFLVASGGRVLAPLSLQSINSSLVYVRARNNDWTEPLFDNVNNSLRELCLHDSKDVFEAHKRRYELLFPTWRGKLLCWNEVQSWLTQQLTSNPNLRVQERMDILIEPQFVTFCRNTGPANTINAVDSNMSLAGSKWRSADSRYFVVSLNVELFCGETGIHVKVVPGAGLGCQPTTQWVKNWSSPKCKDSVMIDKAIREGKHVVFRSVQPHVDAWCALISFSHGFGYRSHEESMILYNNLYLEDRLNLRSYFGWCRKQTPSAHIQYTGPAKLSVGTSFVPYLSEDFELVPSDCEDKPLIVCEELIERKGTVEAFAEGKISAGSAIFRVDARLLCSKHCKGHVATARTTIVVDGDAERWEDRFFYSGCSFDATMPKFRLPHYTAINKVRALTCLGSWRNW